VRTRASALRAASSAAGRRARRAARLVVVVVAGSVGAGEAEAGAEMGEEAEAEAGDANPVNQRIGLGDDKETLDGMTNSFAAATSSGSRL
jgi:hypothetical protein